MKIELFDNGFLNLATLHIKMKGSDELRTMIEKLESIKLNKKEEKALNDINKPLECIKNLIESQSDHQQRVNELENKISSYYFPKWNGNKSDYSKQIFKYLFNKLAAWAGIVDSLEKLETESSQLKVELIRHQKVIMSESSKVSAFISGLNLEDLTLDQLENKIKESKAQ